MVPSVIMQPAPLTARTLAAESSASMKPWTKNVKFDPKKLAYNPPRKTLSPEVLKVISDNADIDLVPVVDYEIAHKNVQLGPGDIEAVRQTPIDPPVATDDAISAFEKDKPKPEENTDQTKPIIEWHRDSHPFVCAMMLSDAQHMVGGEVELECGDGRSVKVSRLRLLMCQGSACLLQGRYVTHITAPAAKMPERVTVVTSFRPRDPSLLYESTNMNTRNKSHLTELYYQWSTYRFKVLSQRAQIARNTLRKRYEENVKASDKDGRGGLCRVETVNVVEVEEWMEEQVAYMQKTLHEMRPLEEKNRRVS